MKQSKKSIKKIAKYIRDFSIVVAGIAVTLYVNDKVTNQGEKRDLKLYLNTIKMELEENTKEIDKAIEYLQPAAKYAAYLSSHTKDSMNRDTVRIFEKVFTSAQKFSFNTNAFDMFKTSGIMRLVDSKELLLSIWDVYTNINDLKELLDLGFQMKYDEIKKLISFAKQGDLKDAPLRDFFTDTDITHSMLETSEETLKITKELISKLEQLKIKKR